ncbi:MAG TPA: response regulator [Rheinheimera sp.]|uniref:tetratricopeptide repeat-containing response regulator n=1 Tax=Rheinheimera sp. TaxID=1869214 RepID=UPI000ED6A7A5|nr:tetratricopeptide repeat-containing response regulator [Rheinheimera sp.]HCU65127.1 response regulator [Rheinheimera sp.]
MDQNLSREIKILIIDEQALAQNYLRFALEKLGYTQVHFTDKAQSALQMCNDRQFDLIICSFNLQQGKDGYQLYEELKVRRIQKLSTGFIFISAETDPSLVYSVLELQPDEFLAKPYTMRDLQNRIERVLKRKQELMPIYQWLEQNRLDRALQQLDHMLAEGQNPKLVPVLLRFKGDLLLQLADYDKAQLFFRSVLAVQPFNWARMGLVKTLLAKGDVAQATAEMQQLEQKGETRLFALEQLAELEFRREEFELAQQHLEQATSLAPRNLFRQQKLQQLSRLNHDYERQYKAARDMVKFARYSMYEQPELYLNLARACIDFAVSLDEDGETNKLSKQANDCLSNLKSQFPDADTKEQQLVVQARLLYLKDQKDKAKKLLAELDHNNIVIDNLEAALDKAKALHEVGLSQASRQWFEQITRYCQQQQTDPYLKSYLQQESNERAELTTPPRELNNIAVMHFQHGNWQAALAAFEHAFRLLPRNSGIALNLLQSMLTAPEHLLPPQKRQHLTQACLRTIEKGKLDPEQNRRFEQLKLKHPAVFAR